MYTNVLRAIIRLSTLVFPENLTPGEIDALARSSVWDSHTDYPQITGHGVGSYLSVYECKLFYSNIHNRQKVNGNSFCEDICHEKINHSISSETEFISEHMTQNVIHFIPVKILMIYILCVYV